MGNFPQGTMDFGFASHASTSFLNGYYLLHSVYWFRLFGIVGVAFRFFGVSAFGVAGNSFSPFSFFSLSPSFFSFKKI